MNGRTNPTTKLFLMTTLKQKDFTKELLQGAHTLLQSFEPVRIKVS